MIIQLQVPEYDQNQDEAHEPDFKVHMNTLTVIFRL